MKERNPAELSWLIVIICFFLIGVILYGLRRALLGLLIWIILINFIGHYNRIHSNE